MTDREAVLDDAILFYGAIISYTLLYICLQVGEERLCIYVSDRGVQITSKEPTNRRQECEGMLKNDWNLFFYYYYNIFHTST